MTLGLIGGLSFLIVVISGVPASLMAPIIDNSASGIAYRSINGTIWNAQVTNVSIDGVYLGDIRAKFRASHLLRAALAYKIDVSGGGVRSQSILSQSFFGTVAVRDANVEIGSGVLGRYFLMGVPISGSATLSNSNIARNRNGCISADGSLNTDALGNLARQFGLPNIDLIGTIDCVDRKLSAELHGAQEDMGAIEFKVSELDAFRYRMRVTVTTQNDQLKQALQLAGFMIDGDVVTYDEVASWTAPLQPTTDDDAGRSNPNGV